MSVEITSSQPGVARISAARYPRPRIRHRRLQCGRELHLAGKERGGPCVRALEEAWQEAFEVKHAIACNSATSGLLALSLVAVGSVGAFPFHQRLIRTFESLPIVGSLLVGVWIPTAVSLVVMGEIGTITARLQSDTGMCRACTTAM